MSFLNRNYRRCMYCIAMLLTVFTVSGPLMAWDLVELNTTENLKGIWGSSESDIYAVGTGGTILSYDGNDWAESTIPQGYNLNGVWGTGPDNVYAVGDYRAILRNQGSGWNLVHSQQANYWLKAITGPDTDTGDLLAVGETHTIWVWFVRGYYNMVQGNGNSFSAQEQHNYSQNLHGAWTSPSGDTIVVGNNGLIADYDGRDFWGHQDLDSFGTPTSKNLKGIWGTAMNDIFAVGNGGTILHYNGGSWSLMSTPTTSNLKGVWGSASDDVYAVGNDGVVLHYDGAAWSDISDDMPVSEDFSAVWGSSAEDVYITGDFGTLIRKSSGIQQYSVVCDPATDLCWQDPQREAFNYNDQGMRAFEADQYCDELVLGGLDDWRVPTIAELRTITQGYANTETGGACPLVDGTITYAEAQDLNCFNLDDATFHNGPGDNGCFLKPGFTGTCDKGDPYSGGHPLEHVAYETPADTDAWRATLMFENGSVLFNHGCTGADVRCVRDDDGSPVVACVESAACAPGETKECPCDGFGDRPNGLQSCNTAGDCWGPCDCAQSIIDTSVDPECHMGDVIYDASDILNVNISLPDGHTIDYDPASLQTFLYECPDASTPIPTRPPDGGSWDNQIKDPGQPPYSVEIHGVTYYREEHLTGPYCLLVLMSQQNVIPPMPAAGDYTYWDASQPINFPLPGGTMTLDIVLDRLGGCPAAKPYECPGTGACELSAADCCPVETPFKCQSGTCVADLQTDCGPDSCGNCSPPCPDDSQVFTCRYPGFLNFYTGCADFPPSEGWPAGDTPENWAEMQAICNNMPNNSGAGTVTLGQTCRYYEGGVNNSTQHCIFEAEDGVHNGMLYYAIGINSIGCSSNYGAVSSLLDGPLCTAY